MPQTSSRGRSDGAREEQDMTTHRKATGSGSNSRRAALGEYARMPDPRSAGGSD